MPIIICPGVHSPELTDRFVQSICERIEADYLILPTAEHPPYNAIAVYQWLERQQLSKTQALSFIAFSAGVVGGIGAAMAWQLRGGNVRSFVALDGWGMPLGGNFSRYRVSHDAFTHWSSSILGAGAEGFYADPEVDHLELWRSPELCRGWRIISPGCQTRDTLLNYLTNVLSS